MVNWRKRGVEDRRVSTGRFESMRPVFLEVAWANDEHFRSRILEDLIRDVVESQNALYVILVKYWIIINPIYWCGILQCHGHIEHPGQK